MRLLTLLSGNMKPQKYLKRVFTFGYVIDTKHKEEIEKETNVKFQRMWPHVF